MAYNRINGITPQPIMKQSRNEILSFLDLSRKLNREQLEEVSHQVEDLSLEQIPQLIQQLEEQMKEAAEKLEFEEAAKYRDRIQHLRDKLLGINQN